MLDLISKAREELVAEVLIYLDCYTKDLHPDDLFALKTDLTQMITDKMEDLPNE
tara:strand:- start:7237 stop:7398 length:162 start_codon:yes stop_codon:yes gene_type:complete